MRISDWSSDVCSSDLPGAIRRDEKIAVLKPRRIGLKGFDLLHLADHGAHGAASSAVGLLHRLPLRAAHPIMELARIGIEPDCAELDPGLLLPGRLDGQRRPWIGLGSRARSEEHTSELQSLMRISYAVFC